MHGINVYKICQKYVGKRAFGRPRHRWDIQMNLKEMGCEDVDWTHLAQDRGQ
jgi:hypothetical protein